MAWRLSNLSGPDEGVLDAPRLDELIDEHERLRRPALENLWNYYRNPMEPAGGRSTGRAAGRAYTLAQERGLPPRLIGRPAGAGPALADDRAQARREIVIENDIAWRLHTMVDFLFSRPVRLVPVGPDASLHRRIAAAVEAAWEASGGAALMQDMALLGHVYGHVDLVVRVPEDLAAEGLGADQDDPELLRRAASRIRVELVPATRGIPVQNPDDYRRLDGYILRSPRAARAARPAGFAARFFRAAAAEPTGAVLTELFLPGWRQVYIDEGQGPRLIDEGENRVCPGRVPVVHIQNVSQPLAYAGLGEVEPLIPLQDELNTRLSDRASRVTMQSFKMYLARGIENFDKAPIGPGQVWSTDNADARIEAFGGDAASPSEDAHIDQIREALDKASGVPPLATGVVRAKVGNLTSENALRLTLQGLLSRTNRKRLLYGRGIADASALILAALHHAGLLHTSEQDRQVRVEWPDAISRSSEDELRNAITKRELGFSDQRVLSDLGIATGDDGVA
jgi:hypothetical protein